MSVISTFGPAGTFSEMAAQAWSNKYKQTPLVFYESTPLVLDSLEQAAVCAVVPIENLSAPEVSAELGITVEAVKSRLHRARSMVREKLVASGYWNSATDLESDE